MMRELSVMLVDDDEIDREYVHRLFEKHNLINHLRFAKDGYEAYSRLKGLNDFEKEQIPDLILLDINMPRMNGLEFLEAMRKESEFSNVKVVMLSTSDRHEDKIKSIEYGIEKYVVKPIKYEDLEPVLKTIGYTQGYGHD